MPRRKTHEEFVNEVKNKYGEKYDILGVYKNSETKIKVRYRECGHINEAPPRSILNGHGCIKCQKANMSTIVKIKDVDFKKRIKSLFGDEYIFLDKYQGMHTKINVIHNACGTVWKIKPNTFLTMKNKCPTCHHSRIAYDDEKFRNKIIELCGNEYIPLEKYSGMETKIKMKHIKCGHEWKVQPNSFINMGSRCPLCKPTSKGEIKIIEILENNNVNFIKEYVFEDCKNIRNLRFDFAIFDKENKLMLLIEFDGKQHFRPTYSEEEFKNTRLRDSIKNKYCEDNNLTLLRIPYWEFDNIEEILTSKLKELDVII